MHNSADLRNFGNPSDPGNVWMPVSSKPDTALGHIPYQDAPDPQERRHHIAVARLWSEDGRAELDKRYAQSNAKYQMKTAETKKGRGGSRARLFKGKKENTKLAGAAKARVLSVIRYSGMFNGSMGMGKGKSLRIVQRSDGSVIRNIAGDLGGLFRRHQDKAGQSGAA